MDEFDCKHLIRIETTHLDQSPRFKQKGKEEENIQMNFKIEEDGKGVHKNGNLRDKFRNGRS